MRRILRRALISSALVLGLLFACARVLPPPTRAPLPPSGEAGPEAAEEGPRERSRKPREVPAGHLPSAAAEAGVLRPIPERLRVGLATDLESVTFPCCEGTLVAFAGDEHVTAADRLVVEPAVTVSSPPRWRLQVAALRDEQLALGLASRLRATLGLETDVVFDAGTGTYRVRAGAFARREEAESWRSKLAQRNIHEAWVVSEQAMLDEPAMTLRHGKRRWLVRGRWLAFQSEEGQGIPALGRRFRGRILVFLNDRGTLNLINEVELDQYLRGVVPKEMGPNVYDHLEALKAQAVAARSYTLRNIGEFEGEGYDICATARCQVYGGMDAEHELSDRAVLETTRQVLARDGLYADALYSSTCGGHTEDVEVVFPLKSEPYLRGVPCHEAGVDRLAGALERGTPLEVGLGRTLVPSQELAGPATDFAARLKALAGLAGLEPRAGSLGSLDRRDVQQFLASQFEFATDARLLVAREDVPYLLEETPADWGEEDLRLAAYMMRSGLLSRPVSHPIGADEVDEIVFRLGLFLRLLEERRVRYLELDQGELVVREGSEQRRYEMHAQVATFSRRHEGFLAAPLALVAGDRLVLYLQRGRLVGIGQEVDLDGVAYDRTSNLSAWTRFRSDGALAELVAERYPELGFSGVEILERGVSGRVGRIRVLGEGGDGVEIVGLPVRWVLDLPDTLFTARRLEPSEREAGWLFTGRGWGHGVGMCQVGAYGMAIRGHAYDEILHHYYTGVALVEAPLAQSTASSRG